MKIIFIVLIQKNTYHLFLFRNSFTTSNSSFYLLDSFFFLFFSFFSFFPLPLLIAKRLLIPAHPRLLPLPLFFLSFIPPLCTPTPHPRTVKASAASWQLCQYVASEAPALKPSTVSPFIPSINLSLFPPSVPHTHPPSPFSKIWLLRAGLLCQ